MIGYGILKKSILQMKLRKMTKNLKSMGKGVELDHSTQLIFPERIEIGNHIYIGPGGYLNGRGGLIVEDHVIMAPDVAIMTSMHRYKDAQMVPYDQVELLKPVKIERCVWLGMRVTIMPGVTIGEGSIVGAGSVVTKSCPAGSILGGNPARIIGTRDMEHYRKCIDSDQFYLKLKQENALAKQEMVP